MADYTIVADVSRWLTALLRQAVVPALLPNREQVSLSSPDRREGGCVLGVCLYDIGTHTGFVPGRAVSPASGMVSPPPRALALYYLVFLNRHAQSPPEEAVQQELLGRVLQAAMGAPQIDVAAIHRQAGPADEAASLTLSSLDWEKKQGIWSAINEPLRPAVYLQAGPLLLEAPAAYLPPVREGGAQVEHR